MVIERFGKFHEVLPPGVHFVIPFVDRPKTYWYRYYSINPAGRNELNERYGSTRIPTQNTVIDFPKQNVITHDNASVFLDAVLSYRITTPKTMIYSCTNLPHILSKLLQAQLRNVAGSLDIDQIIEDSASLNVLTGLMDNEATRWGVKIEFVKVQRVEAMRLTDVLAQKKNADLKNKEVVLHAKSKKQTMIIESEGVRDSMIKKAEGEAQEILSRARGQAQAILNTANAEAKSISEIARVMKSGQEPAKYLLSTKYLNVLGSICEMPNTEMQFLPRELAYLQTLNKLGLNTIHPKNEGKERKEKRRL